MLHRVETLKEFCDFVETELEMMMGSAQRRWLALLLTIERVFKFILALKSYLHSQENIPVTPIYA
jgi:hypothetical protein